MYLRFVIEHRNPDSHHRAGLFQGNWWLEEHYEFAPAELAEIEDLYAWFGEHLRRPNRFSRSAKPHAQPRAICWFKAEAHAHIRQMHRLAMVLRRHGVPVAIVTTRRPGYIVYEDDAQIAAEPFRDTRT